jgi:hypothetical protein
VHLNGLCLRRKPFSVHFSPTPTPDAADLADCRPFARNPGGLCEQPIDHAALNAAKRLQGAASPAGQEEKPAR